MLMVSLHADAKFNRRQKHECGSWSGPPVSGYGIREIFLRCVSLVVHPHGLIHACTVHLPKSGNPQNGNWQTVQTKIRPTKRGV